LTEREVVLVRKTFTSNQIQFFNLMIDDLTQSGWMIPVTDTKHPFTDFSPRGVAKLFLPKQTSRRRKQEFQAQLLSFCLTNENETTNTASGSRNRFLPVGNERAKETSKQ
jgi:hypothetical protein